MQMILAIERRRFHSSRQQEITSARATGRVLIISPVSAKRPRHRSRDVRHEALGRAADGDVVVGRDGRDVVVAADGQRRQVRRRRVQRRRHVAVHGLGELQRRRERQRLRLVGHAVVVAAAGGGRRKGGRGRRSSRRHEGGVEGEQRRQELLGEQPLREHGLRHGEGRRGRLRRRRVSLQRRRRRRRDDVLDAETVLPGGGRRGRSGA